MEIDTPLGDLSQEQEAQQMLSLVTRLRYERNEYRSQLEGKERDLDFLKVESAFTIQSLRDQLRNLARKNKSPSTSSSRTPSPTYLAHLQRTALASAIVAQHSDAKREQYAGRLGSTARALEETTARLREAEGRAVENDAVIRKMHSEDVEMRDNLATTEYRLSTLESRNADLAAAVARYKEELETAYEAKEELADALARSEAQVMDAMKRFEESEAQRSSQALQISHLEQDLSAARQEVAEADSRYSALQTKQLASMSTTGQLRALREQIEDQEQRVMRRNEQIGVHQHDIKRLETNLKLQEERVTEMTAELETAEAEKLAMIEDCRTTREERDEALRRCGMLEESMEVLEDSLLAKDRQRDSEIAAVVSVAMDAVAKRRLLLGSFTRGAASRDERIDELSHQLQETQHTAVSALSISEHHSTSYQTALSQLGAVEQQLRDAIVHQARSEEQSTSATIALATVIGDFRRLSSVSRLRKEHSESMQADFAEVTKKLEARLEELSALQARHDTLLNAKREQDVALTSMQDRYDTLQQSFGGLQEEHEQVLNQLSHAQEEAQAHASNSAEMREKEAVLRAELETAQSKFEQEASDLRAQLSQAVAELEDGRVQKSNLESAHRQMLGDLTEKKEELQQNLEDALRKLEYTKSTEDELKLADDRRSTEIMALREELRTIKRTLEETARAHDELQAQHSSLTAELEQRRQEASDISRAKEDLENELQALRVQHGADANSLQQRLDEAVSQTAQHERALSELQTRYDEAVQQKHELEDSLAAANSALEGVKIELNAETERRAQDGTEHQTALETTREKQLAAEAARRELEAEIDVVRQRLREAEEALQDVQRQKDEVQTNATALQADVQRSLSLKRSQEAKIQECEREIGDLKKQLGVARADYSRSEQNAKSAEMQLTLQNIKHKEAVESLNEQLAKLQANSVLHETILDLREKTEDLERLLQEKNVEIEENDDRFIHHNKEKKKLTSKVDALTRKAKTLQEKLDRLETGSQDSTPKALPAVAPLGPPLLTPAASAEHAYQSAMADIVPGSSRSRSLTGPAAVSRPKTPEAIKSIFRARTPESRHAPPQPPLPPLPPAHLSPAQPFESFPASSSSTSIGKKRRAPEDFEDHDSVPVQSFSADCAPVGRLEGAKTPRGSRRLGFTPMRGGSSSRPATSQPASPPRRAATAAGIIADVTNSPRSKTNVLKKGWLKVKPGASQTSSRTAPSSSRPPIGDRTQNFLGS